MTVEIQEKATLRAIKLLRKKKFNQGLPFMINSDMLDSSQCFLEYPDGAIKIAEANSKGVDFKIVFEYDPEMARKLRRKLKLI